MEDFFGIYPGTPTGADSSVHSSSTFRIDKARQQAARPCVEVKKIIALTAELLNSAGIKTTDSPILKNPEKVDYNKIKQDYALTDERDLVWLKFTADGYLGVVAASNDINFDIPESQADYNLKKTVLDPYTGLEKSVWAHNTSGIIVHTLGKKWDTSFVLLFPLPNMPKGLDRSKAERAVGNYLIAKGVPILDFYSHNY